MWLNLCAATHWQEFHWLFCGNIWTYVAEAWAARCDPNVLLVFYEDLKDDAEAQVRRIAGFMGVEIDDALVASVVERSGHAYMMAHSTMFDEHWIASQQAALGRWGIDGRPNTSAPKVTSNGTHGAHASALSASTAAMMDAMWAERVLPDTGLASFPAMRSAAAAETTETNK